MLNATFTYQYSAEKNKEVENIRSKYLPKEENKFERLKHLDRKVQNAGVIESLCVGIVGSLVFGVGMCIGLGAIAGKMWLAVVLGVIGTIIMIPAYFIYKKIAQNVKEELAPEILKLSEEIMQNQA